MKKYSVEHSCNKINSEWDMFVGEASGTIFQTTAGANFCKDTASASYHCIAVKEKNNNRLPVAGCIINVQQFPHYGKVGYIVQGPCFKNKSAEVTDSLIAEIKRFSRRHRLSYLIVALNYTENHLSASFLAKGFSLKNRYKPPFNYWINYVKAAWALDLKPSIDDIFNQMKKNMKKSITKALQHPINVRAGGREDLECAYNLMQTVSTRHNNSLYYSLDDLYMLWDHLAPAQLMLLTFAEVNGKAICSDISFTMGKTFYAFFWGWNGEYREYGIAGFFKWKLIEYAKKKGFEWIDFLEVDIVSYQAILNNNVTDLISKRYFFGATLNKMMYGGTLKEYYPTLVYYPCFFKKMYFKGMYAIRNLKILKTVKRLIKS